jgi:hypothetical protein
VYGAQTAPLRAVPASLSQWEVHIGAMNKLVVGAISLQQANQFWNQTRVGAQRRLDRYDVAQRKYDRRTARCPLPKHAASGHGKLAQCQSAVRARHLELERATVALDTWQLHVHHMEMLRRGEMTPEQATQMWLASWHRGVQEVRAYRAAAKAARGTCCC